MAGFFKKLLGLLKREKAKPRGRAPSPTILKATADPYGKKLLAEAEKIIQKEEPKPTVRQVRSDYKSPLDRFLEGEWVANFFSSNVAGFSWREADSILIVQYKDGSIYQYEQVHMEEAVSMFQTQSKGGWVWDNLRIRGTKLGYRKPYYFLSGVSPDAIRKWEETHAQAAAHGLEAERQTQEVLGYLPENEPVRAFFESTRQEREQRNVAFRKKTVDTGPNRKRVKRSDLPASFSAHLPEPKRGEFKK